MHQSKELEKKYKTVDSQNSTLRGELTGILRENERLACEVETMTEQMHALISTYEEHRDAVAEVTALIAAYRREVTNEQKVKDEVAGQLRTHKTFTKVMDEKIDNAARRKYILKTCIADVFVSSAT